MPEPLSEVDAARKEAIAAVMAFGEGADRVEETLIRLSEVDPLFVDSSDETSDGSQVRRHLATIDEANHDLLILLTSLFGRERVAALFAGEMGDGDD